MPLRSHIAQSQQIGACYLVFDRELIFFGVGKPISIEKRWRTANCPKRIKEVRQVIVRRTARRMFGRKVQRRLGYREKVRNRGAGSPVGKRGGGSRLILSRIVTKRSVSDFIEISSTFKRTVENAPSLADARGTGSAEDLAEDAVMFSERISEPESRCEIVPTSRSQRVRNVRVTREYPPSGRTRKNNGLFPGN